MKNDTDSGNRIIKRELEKEIVRNKVKLKAILRERKFKKIGEKRIREREEGDRRRGIQTDRRREKEGKEKKQRPRRRERRLREKTKKKQREIRREGD